MKRYVVEMANDFEKKYPDKAGKIIKIRNLYLSYLITEVEAVQAMVDTVKGE